MCFSASASFTSGGLLFAGGTYLLQKRKIPPHGKFLSIIPLVFAIHQLLEGFVWLGQKNPLAWYYSISVYLFTFIANSFWPIFLPFAMIYYEKTAWMRKVNLIILLLGLFGGLYLFWAYTLNDQVVATINCHQFKCQNMAYNFKIPYLRNGGPFLYLFIISVPLFLTKNKKIRYMLGPAFLLSFLISKYLAQYETFPSVWCFFSAIVSFIFLFVFPSKVKKV